MKFATTAALASLFALMALSQQTTGQGAEVASDSPVTSVVESKIREAWQDFKEKKADAYAALLAGCGKTRFERLAGPASNTTPTFICRIGVSKGAFDWGFAIEFVSKPRWEVRQRRLQDQEIARRPRMHLRATLTDHIA